MSSLVLTGLDGSSPLGFMAAVGAPSSRPCSGELGSTRLLTGWHLSAGLGRNGIGCGAARYGRRGTSVRQTTVVARVRETGEERDEGRRGSKGASCRVLQISGTGGGRMDRGGRGKPPRTQPRLARAWLSTGRVIQSRPPSTSLRRNNSFSAHWKRSDPRSPTSG